MADRIDASGGVQRSQVCVCICTFRRPAMLARLLEAVLTQETKGRLDFSIVVVDNDELASAKEIVERIANGSPIAIAYHLEREQNIALARNRALASASGDLVAFIDDDEMPCKEWLLNLYGVLVSSGADGALGPVLPTFEYPPPSWVLKGRFFDRPSHPTGSRLDWTQTRTGNALLRRQVFPMGAIWFDPRFGSGGEDRDMFRRLIDEGRVFVWCNEAPVYESVPANRWKRAVLVRRALLRGKMALNATDSRLSSVLRSSAAFLLYLVALPATLFLGHHVFMQYLIRACDHLGKILAYFGWDVVKEKYVSG